MIFRNYTPFPPIIFESRDQKDRDFHVIAIRGTFNIIPDAPLRPAPDQHPIVESDLYFDEPNTSSLKMESDLAPYKPRSDIHINAIAHAPDGIPRTDWLVRATIGKLPPKVLQVTGSRYWRHHLLGGWKLSKPKPCVEVPIRYELAFGGICSRNGENPDVFDQNPVGVGYVGKNGLKTVNKNEFIQAPQIQCPNDPITKLGQIYQPQGLGPMARSWMPRLGSAGTYDDNWGKKRWPNLPGNFDFAHYNSAHPDMIYSGLLKGDEEIMLEYLHPTPLLRFTLPKYVMMILIRYQDGQMIPAPMILDTVLINVPENQAHLTWRVPFGKEKPIRVIEARMDHPGRQSNG